MGTPDGSPILALHGMPNTRLMWQSVDAAAKRHHLRIIGLDRVGYGLSRKYPRQSLLGFADVVEAFANAMKFEKFSLLAVSGGGPYGLATAYRLPQRLQAVGIISTIGPLYWPDALQDMEAANKTVFSFARLSPFLASHFLTIMVRLSLPQMRKFVEQKTSPNPELSPELFATVVNDLTEAVKTSRAGIHADLYNYWHDWGFRLEELSRPVHLWHGDADTLAPTALAKRIVAALPNCQAVFYPDENHVGPLANHIDEIFATLAAAAS